MEQECELESLGSQPDLSRPYDVEPLKFLEDDEVEDVETSEITAEKLEQVQRKLGLVRLTWPSEPVRLGDNEYLNALPESYRTVSPVERTLMWYAENFRKQYRIVYPNRKPLLFTCANECRVQKFVSTSIRRTLLPYAELSTWQGCANFTSDYFAYEPLSPPYLLPKHLYSPTYLLHIRRANSFELANFLVSLLLGLGYNAYVVSGYASREQTRCDRRMHPCPYLPPESKPEPPPPAVDKSKYRPKSPPDFQSKFLAEMEARERRKVENEIAEREEQRRRMIIELERPPVDKYFGQRIHGWVVLLPSPPDKAVGPASEISEPIFIEPSTGMAYSPSDPVTSSLYLGVESLWNHRNYWVNMQDCSEACAKLDWDLTNVKLWEHLLAGEPRESRYVEDDEDDEVNVRRDFHMVMPASYVDHIEIPYKDYELRYPNGSKTIYFKKCKVNLYGPYLRPDGLVESVTRYEDYEYKRPIFVYEKFDNRSDCLVRSEKDLDKELVVDYYAEGRPDFCKVHQYFMNNSNTVDDKRTLEFYEGKRLDELYRLNMHPFYASQEYGNREDRLYNRFVEFSPYNEDNVQNNIHYRMIVKIVEKFYRNEELPATKDIAIREFDFVDNEIRLTYQFDEGQYTQATRTFIKPPVTERGDKLVFTPDMTNAYNPDPLATPEDFDDLIDELIEQLNEEENSILEIRKAEKEIFTYLATRKEEFSKPKLKISPFDPIRNEEARAGLIALEEQKESQSQREIEETVDVLAPYLSRLGNLKYLTQKQAIQVRDDCLNDFKKSLIDRANKILREFDKCSNKLENLQSALSKSEGMTREEKEALLEEVSKMNFKLHALQVRLDRHRDLAPLRFRKLLDTVQSDRRLSILFECIDKKLYKPSGNISKDKKNSK